MIHCALTFSFCLFTTFFILHLSVLKPSLIEELVRKREQELAERKEKRKKNSETTIAADEKKEIKGEAKSSASSSFSVVSFQSAAQQISRLFQNQPLNGL